MAKIKRKSDARLHARIKGMTATHAEISKPGYGRGPDGYKIPGSEKK